MRIRVGHARNPNNHVGLNDNSVSRVHLEVDIIDDDTFWITDLGSINGTRIDEREIVESTLNRNQTIKIGHQVFTGDVFFDMVIRQMPLPTQVIWVKEFAELESEFKKYEKEKNKLSQSFQNKMNILRGVLVVSFGMMFYFIGSSIGLPPDFRFITSAIGGVLAGGVVPYLLSKENIVKDNLSIKKEYSKKLKCPRCKRDLAGFPYFHWKEEKRCSSCHAVWVQ